MRLLVKLEEERAVEERTMWHSPLSFPPSSADVLTRNPRSKLALQQLREREARLQKEAKHRSKLRRMAARGLLPTQIDSASGVALGHAFKLEREEEESKQRALRASQRNAEEARRRQRPGAPKRRVLTVATPAPGEGSSTSNERDASGRSGRASKRSYAKPWASVLQRPKTADDLRAERAAAIQNITVRNDKIKEALRARSASSAAPQPVRRNKSAPTMSHEALSATVDHFAMTSDMGAAFEFSDSSSDDDADYLPGLEAQPARPVTAPLQPAGHIFNYLDELATRPLSDGTMRGRPNANMQDTLKAVDTAYSHTRYDESRPSTPYLEQVLANDSLCRAESSWASESTAWGANGMQNAGNDDDDEEDGADESRDTFNYSLENQVTTPDQMFRLAGCGITTAMTSGIGAQIAQCQGSDDGESKQDTFRVDLRANGFGDLGALAVVEGVLANKRVTSLDLGQNQLGSSSGESAKVLLEKSSLTAFDISENSIGNKGVAAICQGLAGSSRLEELRMDKCGFDSVGAVALANALAEGAGGLKTLSISGNLIGTGVVPRQATVHRAGARDLIDQLAHHPHLQVLNLSWNSFGDSGAVGLLDTMRDSGIEDSSLQLLDLSASNLTERGAKALCELMAECSQLTTLKLNQNPSIGFRGSLPFLRMKQAGEIDEVIFGRGASAKPPPTRGANERWRTVELRGCSCENLPMPMMTVSNSTGAVAGDAADSSSQEPSATDAAPGTSTDASFAVPVLASAEQRELLACSIAGWGDEVPWTWKQELPNQVVDEHFELLYAARKAARQARADEDAARARTPLSQDEKEQLELAQKAAQEAAEARNAAAIAQREMLEAAEAELNAQKEWDDVKAIEQRLRSLDVQYEELLKTDDTEAIDRMQEVLFNLREKLAHERWEAEEADKKAAKERAEAEQAQAEADREQLEAEAAAAKAGAKQQANKRKKKSAGLRVQASRGHAPGAMTAPSHGTHGPKPATSAVQQRRAAAMARMGVTPTRSPTRQTRGRSSKMNTKAWQTTKSFQNAVKRQVSTQRFQQQSAITMCKSLKLPLRPSSASGPMGRGAQAPLLGSFSADPLDVRLRGSAAREAELRRQPAQHGLSFAHPQLITEKEARQRKYNAAQIYGGQEIAAWEARETARQARRQSEAHPRSIDTVVSPQRHPQLYA